MSASTAGKSTSQRPRRNHFPAWSFQLLVCFQNAGNPRGHQESGNALVPFSRMKALGAIFGGRGTIWSTWCSERKRNCLLGTCAAKLPMGFFNFCFLVLIKILQTYTVCKQIQLWGFYLFVCLAFYPTSNCSFFFFNLPLRY